jgi:hypothetical protein
MDVEDNLAEALEYRNSLRHEIFPAIEDVDDADGKLGAGAGVSLTFSVA